MPDRSGLPSRVFGAAADTSGLPSAPRGTPSLGRFFHCATTGAGSAMATIHATSVNHTSLRICIVIERALWVPCSTGVNYPAEWATPLLGGSGGFEIAEPVEDHIDAR